MQQHRHISTHFLVKLHTDFIKQAPQTSLVCHDTGDVSAVRAVACCIEGEQPEAVGGEHAQWRQHGAALAAADHHQRRRVHARRALPVEDLCR